jgi:four helix bundle protein
MSIRRFEDIEAWQLARELTRQVYQHTQKAPFFSDFGLKDQIQRASSSIMQNIAEGFDSESNPEFIRFLRYSKRSCSEVQSQLYVALDNTYISEQEFESLYEFARRSRAAIRGFINYLKKHAEKSPTMLANEDPGDYNNSTVNPEP